MKRRILFIVIALIIPLIFATPAFAQGPDGKVVFGESFTLEAEKTLDGDLVVLGGSVTTKESSEIDGDMVVFGGNANIEGDVDGDMVVFGGNVNVNGTVDGDIGAIGGNVSLGESAVVKGDIGLVGGHVNRAEGAVVEGDVQGLNEFDYDFGGDSDDDKSGGVVPPVAPPPNFPGSSTRVPSFFSFIGRLVSDIVETIALLVILGLITWLVATFMPEQMIRVRDTLTSAPPLSFGVGFVSSVVTGFSFLLILTICLAFVPLLAVLLIGIAALLGWIVIGQIIGERLLVSSGRPMPGLIVSAIVGVVVLTVVTNMPVIGEIPFLGVLFSLVGSVVGIVVAFTGIGAVLLTRFGTRPYAGATASSYGGNPSSPSRGMRVRWTEPAPDVSEEDAPSSEEELNAKIKAALVEADKAAEAQESEDDDEEKPKKPKPRRKKPDDEPEEPKSDA